MRYLSTRGLTEEVSGAEAVLRGLAPDGGLYLPADPQKAFGWKALMGQSFEKQAEAVFAWFFDDFPDVPGLVRRAYAGKFADAEITPLRKVGDHYILELFHGPTGAFKDVALSALPVLLSEARQIKIREEGTAPEILILTATSGDTGKAALEGFKDVPGIRIHVFYPYGGVSPVQERQMTSQEGRNVRVSAVRGNFDDAQTAVKQIFSSCPAAEGTVLSSANSINIGRLVPQIVYYFKAYSDLLRAGALRLGAPADFAVPTGNFGDIFAGYLAGKLGLPIGRLICASNRNRILTDFLRTGIYDTRRPFYKTGSPSMDILISSNLERLLFAEAGEDPAERVRGFMKDLSEKGVYTVPPELLTRLRRLFVPGFAAEEEAAETIRRVYKKNGYLLDPHTAVAWCVAEKTAVEEPAAAASDRPTVILSTASPYKFPRTVLSALGRTPGDDDFALLEELSALTKSSVPAGLAALKEKPVRFTEVLDKEDLPGIVRAEMIRSD